VPILARIDSELGHSSREYPTRLAGTSSYQASFGEEGGQLWTSLNLPEGSTLLVQTLPSNDDSGIWEIDTYLELWDANTGQLVAKNDDGGVPPFDKLEFVADGDRHLLLNVSSYSREDFIEGDSFGLSVEIEAASVGSTRPED
ncbi:MAG: hypothetical protein ACR2RE_18105, partial [Geminicoccaceae bacterium]